MVRRVETDFRWLTMCTDDQRTKLKAKGVQFISEPAERPYGIEAVFKDNSGNWFSLTQPTEGN